MLTLHTFCGQVGSVGYGRKCIFLTCEKLNLKPTQSGFSGKANFLGMPVTILGRKQCGNFQIQIKFWHRRGKARLEKKRSWQNTMKQVKNCFLFLSPIFFKASFLLEKMLSISSKLLPCCQYNAGKHCLKIELFFC